VSADPVPPTVCSTRLRLQYQGQDGCSNEGKHARHTGEGRHLQERERGDGESEDEWLFVFVFATQLKPSLNLTFPGLNSHVVSSMSCS